MANKTIHELTPASTITGDYEFAVYDTDSDSTKKATASQILDTEDLLYADDEDEPSEEVDFTSQDTSLNPSESVSVDLLSGNDSWSQRFVKISQMFKNIRYLFGKVGNTVMGTSATTLTEAIAEHESDISTLNSNMSTLNSNMSSVSFSRFVTTANVNKNITIPNNYRGALILTDSTANRNGLYLIYSTGTGAVSTVTVLAAAGLTISSSTNLLTILSAGGTYLAIINIAGGKAT